MVKTGVFKKIAALTAALAAVGSFAVCANAVSINTTTSYVADSENTKVSVTASVTGAGSEVEVTYYATNGSNDVVYVDQATANTEGSATFNYVTAATNLNSAVKVGYTGATGAEETIVDCYSITCNEQTAYVPTTNSGGTYTFNYTMPDCKTLDSVTADKGTTVTSSVFGNNTLTVVLGQISANVTLAVSTKDSTVTNPSGQIISAAAVVSDGENDNWSSDETGLESLVNANEGNRKLTVLGKVNDSDDYGIAISTSEITSLASSDVTMFAARSKNDAGYFAVQLIDTNDDGGNDCWIKSNTDYYVAVYYLNSEQSYVFVPLNTSVKAAATDSNE